MSARTDTERRAVHRLRDHSPAKESFGGGSCRSRSGRSARRNDDQRVEDRARHRRIRVHRLKRDRKELFARAEQARSKAEHANQVKDEFLATLSARIRIATERVSAGPSWRPGRWMKSGPTVRRTFEVIERNVALPVRLINDLLNISSTFNGKHCDGCRRRRHRSAPSSKACSLKPPPAIERK